MSASVSSPWKFGRIGQLCVLLLTFLPRLFAGRLSNCSYPLVPEHGGFRCEPSPCQGFPHKSSVHMFCEPGYRPNTLAAVAWCHHGAWKPPLPACVRLKGGAHVKVDSGVHVASTAAGVSIFLLTTTACLVVKSRLCTCLSHSRRRPSDQLDLMEEGLPVTLPSYEEAVYGSWGQRLPTCSSPGPTQLLLAREPLADQPGDTPPPYEEVQSRGRDRTSEVLHVSLSDDKDI
ncbi:sushi domain-containing protein 6 isoform X2 [Dunckerocampus dactyliophorus]|uniref:sushi domain-containing protein 6 isoform X2 n=1 Tax=Dunckerocampus dactyliophorus TaxID=161453 RepID=UPI002405EDA9|nr:sushi domain-containing protein 6 isoform X2 [Dunckerocampus dactyliophorus]